MDLSTADLSTSPPTLTIPAQYNAAHDLIERNLVAGRGTKLAYIDDNGQYTYSQLAERVNRFASSLQDLGLQMEQRVLLCVQDTIDFPVAFLGAIKAGIVPVPVNTLLTPADYAYMLYDSRALALVISEALLPQFQPILQQSSFLKHVIVADTSVDCDLPRGALTLRELVANASPLFTTAPTLRDEPCFWLYSSGSTGTPKGTVHVHSSLIETAVYYAQAVLGLREDDITFSVAKLFFAYGLGNSLTFPLSVGATAVLMAERVTPASVTTRLTKHRPTVFSGVPTLYASLVASKLLPPPCQLALRLCNSAGESLPEEIARRWHNQTGVEILDGIGSTEMLHIFISNRQGRISPGTLGVPVPGFEARLVAADGNTVPPGEIGHLIVRGPTSAKFYWNQRERSRDTFQGHWTHTGDRFLIDERGDFVFAGRTDDMLKVGGIYVSPIEVECMLTAHPAVYEAAVIGREDSDRLTKPAAYIVLAEGHSASRELEDELKNFVKTRLAAYKYPRWIEFVADLPKTATGKIQRFRLRQLNG
jgi:benzoate-CoA ligase